jgi:hypothetical protein
MSSVVQVFLSGIIAMTLVLQPAWSHIKNEGSQFPDIEFSEARFDIVVLVGAGIIPETPVFEPDKPLTRIELATWAALSNNLAEGGETPDTDALARAALEQGLISALEGQATYAEINDLFFAGQLQLEPAQAEAVPSKAEAAGFIASRFNTTEGTSLLEKRGLQPGPTGSVQQVESRSNPDGGSSYFITVGTTTLPMYAHGRVANGPTDLIQWQGRVIRKSFIRKQADVSLWMYLEAEPVQIAAMGPQEATGTADQDLQDAIQTDHTLLYGLIAGVVVLGVLLFFRRKRVG